MESFKWYERGKVSRMVRLYAGSQQMLLKARKKVAEILIPHNNAEITTDSHKT